MAAVTAFFQPLELHKYEKPYGYHGPDIPGFPKSNFEKKELPINLTDIRSVPDFVPTIDQNGFCFIKAPSKTITDDIEDSTSQPFAQESEDILKGLLETEEAYAINVRFRCADDAMGKIPIAIEAHVDMAGEQDAWVKVRPFLTKEQQERVLSGKVRARVLNIWRPMCYPAEDYPLAILDPDSIEKIDDVVAADRIWPGGYSEAAYLKYDERQRWYWQSNMTPDEAVVFVQFDTHPRDGKFNAIGHTSFKNGLARPGCPPRQSAEARILVLTPAPYARKDQPNLGSAPVPETRAQPWKQFISMPATEKAPVALENKERKVVFGYNPRTIQNIKV